MFDPELSRPEEVASNGVDAPDDTSQAPPASSAASAASAPSPAEPVMTTPQSETSSPSPPPATAMLQEASESVAKASFGGLLKRSFGIYRQQWWKVYLTLGLGLGVFVGLGWVAAAVADTSLILSILLFLPTILVQAWVFIVLIYLISGQEAGITLGEAFGKGIRRSLPFLWVSLLSGLVVLGGYFLIIPGLLWAISFAMLPWVFVADEVGGMQALIRTRRWIRGDLGWFVWRNFMFGLVILIVPLLLVVVISLTMGDSAAAENVTNILTTAFQFLLAPLFLSFTYAIFEDLKRRKGSALPELPKQKTYFMIAAIAGPILLIGIVVLTIGSFIAAFSGLKGSVEDAGPPPIQDDVQGEVMEVEELPSVAWLGGPDDNDDNDAFLNWNDFYDGVGAYGADDPRNIEWKGARGQDDDKDGIFNSIDFYDGPGQYPPGDPRYIEDYAGDDDGDGLINRVEMAERLDPDNPDTDGDGLADGDEERTNMSSPQKADSDGNGISDAEALIAGIDPIRGNQITRNLVGSYRAGGTGKGFHELTRQTLEGSAFLEAMDVDGLDFLDGKDAHLYDDEGVLIVADVVAPPVGGEVDTDGDGLADIDEVAFFSTDPEKADTDGDGFDDGQELAAGFNPLVPGEPLSDSDAVEMAVKIALSNQGLQEITESTLSGSDLFK